MFENLLIIVGGLLGSAHCIGMCGGFVLTLGTQATNWRSNLLRQLLYASGRIAVYTFAGAVVGFGGWRVERELHAVINVQAILSILAGVLLILEGLFSLGVVPRPFAHVKSCPGAGGFASLLQAREWPTVFVAGLVNGLLPCGLVYAYLALAGSTGHLIEGAQVMALFGLGTIPALLLTGLGGSLLSLSWRRRLFHLAAWCMLLTGGIAIYRGASFYGFGQDSETSCPYCE